MVKDLHGYKNNIVMTDLLVYNEVRLQRMKGEEMLCIKKLF